MCMICLCMSTIYISLLQVRFGASRWLRAGLRAAGVPGDEAGQHKRRRGLPQVANSHILLNMLYVCIYMYRYYVCVCICMWIFMFLTCAFACVVVLVNVVAQVSGLRRVLDLRIMAPQPFMSLYIVSISYSYRNKLKHLIYIKYICK